MAQLSLRRALPTLGQVVVVVVEVVVVVLVLVLVVFIVTPYYIFDTRGYKLVPSGYVLLALCPEATSRALLLQIGRFLVARGHVFW